jgi:hypothetical protein
MVNQTTHVTKKADIDVEKQWKPAINSLIWTRRCSAGHAAHGQTDSPVLSNAVKMGKVSCAPSELGAPVYYKIILKSL